MIRWTRNTALLLSTVLAATILFAGCSGKEDFGKPKHRPDRDGTEETKDKTTDGNTKAEGLTPIKGKGVATLKGTVKFVGDEPDFAALTKRLRDEIDKAAADAPICLSGSDPEKTQYSWVIDKGSKGVKNVFVWLRPEDEKKEFFDVKALVDEVKGFDKFKIIDQPHCAFEPHAVVIFPRYVDPAKPVNDFRKPAEKGGPPRTPQQFIVKNTGPLNHNTNSVGDTKRMIGVSQSVPPKGELKIDDIQPFYKSPVELKCSVHPWMKSWVWAFDHPFACVTGSKVGDKEMAMGEYRIDNIPAGVKLRLVAWHEEGGFLTGGEKGKDITLKEGDNTEDLTVSVRK